MFVRFVLLLLCSEYATSARILGIIPTASFAHQVTFHRFWRELSLRGHRVTVITSNPLHNPSLTNLTELDISFVYGIYEKHNMSGYMTDDSKGFLEKSPKIGVMLREGQEAIYKSKGVQDLIKTKDTKFDLVIGEALSPFMLGFGWRFQCPTIGIASLDATTCYHDAMGNIVHPLLNPDDNLPIENPEDMTFIERLMSLAYQIAAKYLYYYAMYPKNHEQAKIYFGDSLPPMDELANNMSMLFTTTHPIFHMSRPVNWNTVSIGTGMHLAEAKQLPKAWQDFLDDAKDGVVYFSLGTNVNPAYTDKKLLSAIIDALGDVPYKVIMKSALQVENLPKNIKCHAWIPQQDVLRHPNVKVFITQGGLQSLQESLSAGIPLIGIPFLGDQFKNCIRMQRWGYGIRLLRKDLTRETLKNTIMEVIKNPKYRERARELGEVLRDQEVGSLQRAVYWTEYVIRHKGARHLRSVATGMPAWKFYMLDAIAALAGVFILTTLIAVALLKFIVQNLLRCFLTKKEKEE